MLNDLENIEFLLVPPRETQNHTEDSREVKICQWPTGHFHRQTCQLPMSRAHISISCVWLAADISASWPGLGLTVALQMTGDFGIHSVSLLTRL